MQNQKWTKIQLKNDRKEQIRKTSDTRTRASYTQIIKPQRFINPFKLYRITPSLVLAHEGRSIYLNFDILFSSKNVDSVECNYPYKNIITVNMTDNSHVGIMAKEYLVARLKSFGDAELFEWALMIQNYDEEYITEYTSFLENVKKNQLTSNQSQLLEKGKEKIQQVSRNDVCIWMEKICNANGVKHHRACYSAKFLLLLGYTKQKFIKTLFEEGIPKFLGINHNKTLECARFEFNNMFLMKWDRYTSKRECKLLCANGQILHSSVELQTYVEIDGSGNLIVHHLIVFDPVSQQQEEEIDSPGFLEYAESTQYLKMINAKEKQIEIFNTKYYLDKSLQEDVDKSKQEEKVCKVKEVKEI